MYIYILQFYLLFATKSSGTMTGTIYPCRRIHVTNLRTLPLLTCFCQLERATDCWSTRSVDRYRHGNTPWLWAALNELCCVRLLLVLLAFHQPDFIWSVAAFYKRRHIIFCLPPVTSAFSLICTLRLMRNHSLGCLRWCGRRGIARQRTRCDRMSGSYSNTFAHIVTTLVHMLDALERTMGVWGQRALEAAAVTCFSSSPKAKLIKGSETFLSVHCGGRCWS